MHTDPNGNKWYDWLLGAISVLSIVGGAILIATGVGSVAGVALIAAGAGSLIGGGVSVATGGSFAEGWAAGAVIGAIAGIAAPYVAGFLSSTFSVSLPVVLGEVIGYSTVTVTGAQLVGAISTIGIIINAVTTGKSNGYWGQKYSNDHTPDHIHLKGPDTNIRIGRDGNPLKGEPPLNSQQRKALKKLWKEFLKLFEKG